MIYLASPYSDPAPAVRKRRHAAAKYATVRLTDRGHNVFSPIAVSGEMVLYTQTTWDAEFWYEWAMDFLRHSDEAWVLCIDGWQESKGVQSEIAEAKRWGIPVKYLDPDTLEATEESP